MILSAAFPLQGSESFIGGVSSPQKLSKVPWKGAPRSEPWRIVLEKTRDIAPDFNKKRFNHCFLLGFSPTFLYRKKHISYGLRDNQDTRA